jgi:hypothetical protein
MARTPRLAALALFLSAAAGAGLAEEPAPPPGPDADCLEAVTDPAEDYPGARRRHYRAAQLLLGLPGSGREQAAVYEEAGCACLLEMNQGDALSPFAVAGLAGGGRLAYRVAGGDDRPALSVSPGVDLWSADPAREAVLAPTVDLSVRHQAGPWFAWEVGLHGGAGYFCGRPAEAGFPRYFPLLGLSAVVRY